MRRLLFSMIFLLCLIMISKGQVPESIKYQTIVRNASSEILANQQITIEIALLQGTVAGNIFCQETFSVTTNPFGLVNLEIGSQDTISFRAIDWSDGPYYVKVLLNGNEMGISELLSVPYALYSGKTEALTVPTLTYEEIYSITNPANGMMVLCSDCKPEDNGTIVIFKSGNWYNLNTSCLPPPAPIANIHDTTKTQITWHWNPVPGAIGYRWNTVSDYNTATDLGNVISKTDEGLFCGTLYTRYIWSYSANCISEMTVLTQKTADCSAPAPCPGLPTVDYEGQIYHTVLINNQCWLVENLNYGSRIDGVNGQSDNDIIEKYCYDDLPANCLLRCDRRVRYRCRA
jgi:hypothetical protein